MKRWTLLLLLTLTACKGITIPPCILDGSCLPHPVPSPPASPPATPAPAPSASPSSSPIPTPSATPEPTPPPPSPTPSPATSPSPAACPQPDDVTLAENTPQPKILGFRNTFDVSPWADGRKITAESKCGLPIILAYGEVQGQIVEQGVASGFEHAGCSLPNWDPRECHADDFWLYADTTNDKEKWSGGRYTRAGAVTYCVSMAHLDHWTCVDCTMSEAGKVGGCGARRTVTK